MQAGSPASGGVSTQAGAGAPNELPQVAMVSQLATGLEPYSQVSRAKHMFPVWGGSAGQVVPGIGGG